MNADEKSVSDRPNPTQRAEIAARHGLNERTLRRYASEGVDLWDDSQIEAHKTTAPTEAEEIKALKAEKLRADTRHKVAQAERAELQLAVERGEVISLPEKEEVILAIAGKVKAQLMRLEAELPPQLEGLNAAKMVPVIRNHVERILEFLAVELGSDS